jgi:nitrite reductase (NADH) small subunit
LPSTGELWVASPLKKQRFRLRDGLCMEDESRSVDHFDARVKDGVVQRKAVILGRNAPF